MVEPHDPEEVVLYRHDDRRGVSDHWMRFDALTDYRSDYADRALEPFPVDPDTLDDDEATGAALGLPPRPVAPDREGWTPRARVPRTEVDMALDGDGDVRATAALLIEPLEPTRGLRLRISMMLEVTDARWRPDPTDRPGGAGLLAAGAADPDADRADPTALTGEPLPFAQEREERTFEDDHFEPWVTVALPRTVAAGESFILELAYEGPLVDRLRQTRDFVLLDTLDWWPQHADNRTSRLETTFRMPERYRVASGGTLVDERVEDDTRIQRWATTEPVGGMAFHYGEFEVTDVEGTAAPAITIYADENHIGFGSDSREMTIADITGAIELFTEYFGPFPYPSLLATETETTSGQAFSGLLFLSYRAFGRMLTGEAEWFRAHEVAHQWWGTGIDWWRDYRDQWMVEGFSNYAAALYALYGQDDPDQFAEMMDAWRLDVLREGHVGQGNGLHYGYRPDNAAVERGARGGPPRRRLPARLDQAALRREHRPPNPDLREGRLRPPYAAVDAARLGDRRRHPVQGADARLRRRPPGAGHVHALVRGRGRPRPSASRWGGSSINGCTASTSQPTGSTSTSAGWWTGRRRSCCTAASARRTCRTGSGCRCPSG